MRLLNESYAHLSNDGLRRAFDARRAEVLRARTQSSDAGRDGWRRTASTSQADSRLHMRQHGADPPMWPAERAGWTVELAQEDDPVIADRAAALARKQGILAGVLNTSHHPSLIPERWLVFAGYYESRNLASRAAKKADAKFAGARPIYVSERM